MQERSRVEAKLVKERVSCWPSRLEGRAETMVKQMAISLIGAPPSKEMHHIVGMIQMLRRLHKVITVPFRAKISSKEKPLTPRLLKKTDMAVKFDKIRVKDRTSLQYRSVVINSRDQALLRPLNQVTYPATHQRTITTLDSVSEYRETTIVSATSTSNSKGKTNCPKNAGICLRAEAIKKENSSFPGARDCIYRRSVPYRRTEGVIPYLL